MRAQPTSSARLRLARAAVFLLLLLLTLGACAARGAGAPADSGAPAMSTAMRTPSREAIAAPTRAPKNKATATPTVALSGLPTISYERLPAQARETIDLIQRGGPFPYRQDGAVFQNRERLLPGKPGGYYHEYTVKTPGSPDRGARRIVTGGQGELYYTDDHYGSFEQVVMP